MPESAYETLAVPVNVAPTATLLYGPVPMRGLASRVSVQLTNLDLSQVLNAWVETRLSPGDSFYRELATDLDDIKGGNTRRASWDLRGCYDVRVMGQASGAGLAARITFATEDT